MNILNIKNIITHYQDLVTLKFDPPRLVHWDNFLMDDYDVCWKLGADSESDESKSLQEDNKLRLKIKKAKKRLSLQVFGMLSLKEQNDPTFLTVVVKNVDFFFSVLCNQKNFSICISALHCNKVIH